MTEGAHASNMPWDWLTGLRGSKRITSRSPSCHHWLHIHLKSHICRSLCGRISFARGTNHPKVVPVYKVQGGNTDHTLKYIKVERMVLKTSKSLCCDLTSLSWEHLFILKEKWWIKKVNWRILKTFALQSSGVFFFFFLLVKGCITVGKTDQSLRQPFHWRCFVGPPVPWWGSATRKHADGLCTQATAQARMGLGTFPEV